MTPDPPPPPAPTFGTVPSSRVSVTLRQLRAFVALAHTHSFTAAAAQLHVTQSTLSALVRDFEAEIGSRLFDRTTRSVDINAAGRELLPVAERVLHDLESGVDAVRELQSKHRGSLTVAATPLLAASFVPGVCAALKRHHPNLLIRVHDRLAVENLRSVRSGEAELAIGHFGPVSEDIALRLLRSGRVGVAVPQAHAFSARSALGLAELQGEPLILLSRDSAFRDLVEHALAQTGCAPRPEYEVAYLGTAIGLVEAGLGLALCPSHTKAVLERAGVRFVPLEPPLISGVSIATLKGRALSPAAEAFVDCALAALPTR
ncbi:LysR family transcriptional regulator [Aquincola sp. S2]|uniref:LysR family transcriptional regulator n=1 Tax=Pseudaquabacterium terrae TaxID=2732868 RepID=A0ABX2ESU9_9BURK|nr:LysR family transcriptional regulator [Aquabacterium terrae]NRF71575.1 LysR family transcriptional regulator [Aquabacterium terrae]